MLETVTFKRLDERAQMPSRAYNSAGYDVFPLEEGIIGPGKRKVIPLGFATAFEPGYAAIVDDRGGVGNKGVTHLAGVIDADYRGEYAIILYNSGVEPFIYSPKKAIAQLLFLRVEEPTFTETIDELPNTVRGTGKFGSSDK
jgi:dUTP pyrophosphatase